MNQIYKTYTPDGEAVIFTTIAEVKSFFDITGKEASKVFYPGVHTMSTGDIVITY